jgi:hypothetical protein
VVVKRQLRVIFGSTNKYIVYMKNSKLKHIKKYTEAIETSCQTPGANYNIAIKDDNIDCVINLIRS